MGPNLVYMAQKEQCLTLGKQLLITFKINDYRIFFILLSGNIQFIHTKDCVLTKKVHTERVAVTIQFSIGNNPNIS